MSYRVAVYEGDRVDFREDDRLESHSNYQRCIQCGRCSASCPAAMMYDDFSPREVMRKVQIGDLRSLINGKELWQCGQCCSCIARCPRDCSPAAAIQALRIVALRENPAIDHMRLIESGVKVNLSSTAQTILPSTLNFPEELMGPKTKQRRSNFNENRIKLGYHGQDSRCKAIPEDDMAKVRMILKECDYS